MNKPSGTVLVVPRDRGHTIIVEGMLNGALPPLPTGALNRLVEQIRRLPFNMPYRKVSNEPDRLYLLPDQINGAVWTSKVMTPRFHYSPNGQQQVQSVSGHANYFTNDDMGQVQNL